MVGFLQGQQISGKKPWNIGGNEIGMGTLRRGGSNAPLIDIERMQQQLPPVLTRDSGLVSGGRQ